MKKFDPFHVTNIAIIALIPILIVWNIFSLEDWKEVFKFTMVHVFGTGISILLLNFVKSLLREKYETDRKATIAQYDRVHIPDDPDLQKHKIFKRIKKFRKRARKLEKKSQFKEALIELKKSLDLETNERNIESFSYLLIIEKKLEEAIANLNILESRSESKTIRISYLETLRSCYSLAKDYENSYDCALRILDLAEEAALQISTLINLANCCIKLQKFVEARNYLNRSLQESVEIEYLDGEVMSYASFIDLATAEGNLEELFKYIKQSRIFLEENRLENMELDGLLAIQNIFLSEDLIMATILRSNINLIDKDEAEKLIKSMEEKNSKTPEILDSLIQKLKTKAIDNLDDKKPST